MFAQPPLLYSRKSSDEDWTPRKFSELMIEFAEPLIYVDSAGPPDINALKSAMTIATLCWNAPLREVEGDPSLMAELAPVLKSAPAPIAAALRQMLCSRMTRFGHVAFPIIAEVTGTSLDDARCVAKALAPSSTNSQDSMDNAPPRVLGPLSSTRIEPLALLFPEMAKREQEVWQVGTQDSDPQLPAGTYLLVERYCAERGCDCRRVMLYVTHTPSGRVIATVGYGFEPPKPPYDQFEKQIELDMLNPQTEHSDAALAKFTNQIVHDPGYRERLLRHYACWKQVVDDPKHRLHRKLAVSQGSAQPVRSRSAEAKVGVNARCLCGSGRKYKHCCRS